MWNRVLGLYIVSQFKWRKNSNIILTTLITIQYLFNVNYKLQQNIRTNFWVMKVLKLLHVRESTAITGNRLSFVLAAVDRVVNETIVCDKIRLISDFHCNIYLAFKFLNKILFSFMKSIISKKHKNCVIVCATCSGIIHRVSKNVPPLACYNFDTHK